MPRVAFYETLPSMLASPPEDGTEEGVFFRDEVAQNKKKKSPKKKQSTADALGEEEEQRKKQTVATLLRGEEQNRMGNLAYLVPPPQNDDYGHDYLGSASEKLNKTTQGEIRSTPQYFITCAAFGKHGLVIWAVTK
jgi:hypothetical protein